MSNVSKLRAVRTAMRISLVMGSMAAMAAPPIQAGPHPTRIFVHCAADSTAVELRVCRALVDVLGEANSQIAVEFGAPSEAGDGIVLGFEQIRADDVSIEGFLTWFSTQNGHNHATSRGPELMMTISDKDLSEVPLKHYARRLVRISDLPLPE